MGRIERIGLSAPPAAVMAVLERYSRDRLATAIEVMIGFLDLYDGDPDLEDATDAEDDFQLSPLAIHHAGKGPGCALSDPGGTDLGI